MSGRLCTVCVFVCHNNFYSQISTFAGRQLKIEQRERSSCCTARPTSCTRVHTHRPTQARVCKDVLNCTPAMNTRGFHFVTASAEYFPMRNKPFGSKRNKWNLGPVYQRCTCTKLWRAFSTQNSKTYQRNDAEICSAPCACFHNNGLIGDTLRICWETAYSVPNMHVTSFCM